MTLNSANFDMKESSFSDDHNNGEDGKGQKREGSGRATIFKETNIPYCFTLECNYVTGVRINPLKPRIDLINKVKLSKEDNYINDVNSKYYKNKSSPIFN